MKIDRYANKIIISNHGYQVVWRGKWHPHVFSTLGEALDYAKALGRGANKSSVHGEKTRRQGLDSQ